MNTDVDIVNDDLVSQEFNFLVMDPKSSNDPAINFDAPESGYEDKERYRLSDTATNSLIKFMRYLLLLVDRNIYSEFPKSLHMARKLFGISDHMIKITQNHSRLDKLSLFVNENQHLLECLPYIALKETVGSLTANEDFDLMKYSEFLTMSKNVKKKTGTGSEPFLGVLLKLIKSVKLSSEILALLVEYYNNAYSNSFVSLSDIHNLLPGTIAVFPQINQFGRLRLRAEVYGSTYAKRHIGSVNVLSKFVLDDNMTDTYSGQIQFFLSILFIYRKVS
ncbi:16217_t:CDS:2 [Funneliformis caledonium]|uniref:16217_t:CDS:1 n=1 Tax=Funneliformis caledonium TaxID=1117310 RepID=A0A9N8W8F7_9GLOM|nr:16217_t:CDS:2 [Funneliformis caledonium]